MGVWHYKQACIVVYRMASQYFIAPLHHHLFPDKKFADKPKFRRMTHVLSIIRLSYANWKPDLVTALLRDTPMVEKQHLKNLSDLLEFFIPMVNLATLWSQSHFESVLICQICSSNV